MLLEEYDDTPGPRLGGLTCLTVLLQVLGAYAKALFLFSCRYLKARVIGRRSTKDDNAPPEPSTLAGLPIELIMQIMDNLETTDAVCLMLTCKRIHKQAADFNHLAHHIDDKVALLDLLLRLERDLADKHESMHMKVYCMDQQKLVSFRRLPAWITTDPGYYYHDCMSRLPSTKSIKPPAVHFPYSEGAYSIHWCRARLVTNSHFWGLRQGIAPSELDASNLDKSIGQVEVAERWKARIVPATGELLFSCVRRYTYKGSLDLRTMKRDTATSIGLDVERNAVCEHHKDAVSGSFPKDGSPNNFEGGCRECHTDWTAEYVRQRPACAGYCKRCDWSVYVVTISTFHNLGDCRSPMNAKWGALLGNSAPGFHQPGSTKALWEECETLDE